MSNFLSDDESNISREVSFGENLSQQKHLANSRKYYTQFIQGALFQTIWSTSKPKPCAMIK